MKQCAHCRQTILFGGVRDEDGHVYCNDECLGKSSYQQVKDSVSKEIIDQIAQQLHQSDCPICGRRGPIDIQVSYRVMSFLIITQRKTISRLSCPQCGRMAGIRDFCFTALLGWWGVPWGLFFTPFYLVKNLISIIHPVQTEVPSNELRDFALLYLIQESQNHQQELSEQENQYRA